MLRGDRAADGAGVRAAQARLLRVWNGIFALGDWRALNTFAEADRPHIVDQPGMRHKYLPLRHDPATGAISSGGRYLFRGYEDATKYRDFLEAKVFPSEQTPFWKRPFFFNTVRFAWCVTGAHDLAPITTHDLNRQSYGF